MLEGIQGFRYVGGEQTPGPPPTIPKNISARRIADAMELFMSRPLPPISSMVVAEPWASYHDFGVGVVVSHLAEPVQHATEKPYNNQQYRETIEVAMMVEGRVYLMRFDHRYLAVYTGAVAAPAEVEAFEKKLATANAASRQEGPRPN